jgi:hypothetical protein
MQESSHGPQGRIDNFGIVFPEPLSEAISPAAERINGAGKDNFNSTKRGKEW